MGSYLPSTGEERRQMLEALGMQTLDDLYAAVPPEVRIHGLDLPEGLSELEVTRRVTELSERNTVFRSVFRGAGAYRHFIPAIVKTITSKEEFLTAYTPYQAEISQGVLQSIFEYQTQICELTGMEVSNASVYDGAVAAAEGVLMNVDGRKRKSVVVSGAADPQILSVIGTYCESRNVPLTVVPPKDHATDLEALQAAIGADTASVYVQSPNFFGILEDVDAVVAAAHAQGAKVVLGVDPISLGILKTPGEYGVDVAVGEGQSLGLSLGFGGPYLGFMAATKELMRKLPGRIVGQTVDAEGRRCFVLTLQAREQHIRREKASSNICSNEALCAMTASVYLAAMGPKGLKTAAESSAAKAHYLARELSRIPGFRLLSEKPFFQEFLMSCPKDPKGLEQYLASQGILGGLCTEEGILWCATEMNSKAEIDRLVSLVEAYAKEAK